MLCYIEIGGRRALGVAIRTVKASRLAETGEEAWRFAGAEGGDAFLVTAGYQGLVIGFSHAVPALKSATAKPAPSAAGARLCLAEAFSRFGSATGHSTPEALGEDGHGDDESEPAAQGSAERMRDCLLVALGGDTGRPPRQPSPSGTFIVADEDNAYAVETAAGRWAWKRLDGPWVSDGDFGLAADYKRVDAVTRKAIAPVNERMACLDEADAGRLGEKEAWSSFAGKDDGVSAKARAEALLDRMGPIGDGTGAIALERAARELLASGLRKRGPFWPFLPAAGRPRGSIVASLADGAIRVAIGGGDEEGINA